MAIGIKTCRRCGEPVPPGALGGNCPRCLAVLALSRTAGEAEEPSGAEAAARGAPQRFFGDYEILGELARGGMGVVYRARQVSLNRPVALKMIAAGQFATVAQVQRFRLEAEAAARLDHPNIVPIYEVGEHQGQHFYSMKLIEGGTLARAESRIDFAPRTSALLLLKIARAVHYGHQRGVLHRDLKPTNILVDPLGEPHVTDFGLAKLFDEDTALTQSNAILGTPAYMAPELASGKAAAATTAADVYSLGAVLYELLSGRPPFIADGVPALLRKIVEEEPVHPSVLSRSRREAARAFQSTIPSSTSAIEPSRPPPPAAGVVERDLEVICLKCLEKDPARRYSTAQSLAEDLERWLAGKPILARPAGRLERLWRWCRRKPALAALSGALVLVSLAGMVGIVWQWRRAEAGARDARQAAAQARDELWRAQLAQARAQRLTGVAGRKEASLAAVQSAVAVRPSPELRDEAVAALALTDVADDGPLQTAGLDRYEAPVFAPDLDLYALWRRRGDIAVFRMATGEKLAGFQGPSGAAAIVQFSPNGRLVIAHFANDEILVWSLTNSALLLRTNLGGKSGGSLSFDLALDHRTLALASGTNGVQLLDIASGVETGRLPVDGNATRVSFRPDGRALAISTATNIVLWNFAESRVTHVLPHPKSVNRFAWNPDSRRLAVACDGTSDVWLWDGPSTNSLILKGHLEVLKSVAFNYRGDLLMSAAYDGSTRFWDAGSGELLFISRAGFGLAFSDDDTRVGFIRENQGLGVWKLQASAIYREVSLPLSPARRVTGFDFSPNGKWIVAASGDGVHVCDLRNGRQLAYASHRSNRSVWFTADGGGVVLVGADHLHLWNAIETDDEIQLQEKARLVLQPGIRFDAGSVTRGARHWLTVPSPDRVFCVDLSAPERWWALPGEGQIGYINSAAISPDTNWIATSYWKDRGSSIWGGIL